MSFLHFPHLFRVPVNLTTNPSDNFDVPCSQRNAGEETSNVEHPVFRVLWINKAYFHKDLLKMIIHPLQFEAVGKAGHGGGAWFAAKDENFITDEHHSV